MAFSDLVSTMDSILLSTLGDDKTVTLHDTTVGGGNYTVPIITANPTLSDDYIPGTVQGTGTLQLFVRFVDAGRPQNGWTATVDEVDYDVNVANPDAEGGVILRLRRRGQRWNR